MAKTQLYLQYYLFSIESMYQWFHINFCWQKCIIHESDVTLASRRLKLPVLRLCGNKIFRTRWNKNKATHYWPFFWGESTSHWWIPWMPLTMRKAFSYHDVIMFRFMCTLWLWLRRRRSSSIFYTWSFPIYHDNRCCNLHEESVDLSHHIS